MKIKINIFVFVVSFAFCCFIGVAQTQMPSNGTAKQVARFEHIAINLADPVAAAKWYSENLGMKVMRAGAAPTFTTFIADSGEHMMLELFHNADYPLLNPKEINRMSLHLAFSTDDIVAMKTKLVAAGAVVVDTLRKTNSGDQVMTVRDPWGLAIQFVQRVTPMLQFKGTFPEHFAVNVLDSRAKAKWYVDNLGFVIVRDGKAPSYGMFIADSTNDMMFELYQNTECPVLDFTKVSHMATHVAFMVNNLELVKTHLLAAGATLVDDITKSPSGDFVLMMRDPWGEPIQFVKRAVPMLK
jgi:glyoxylase I family protein